MSSINSKLTYDISFSLSESEPLPFNLNEIPLSKYYSENDKEIIHNFNTKIQDGIKKTNIFDEKFLYLFCVNATVSLEASNDVQI